MSWSTPEGTKPGKYRYSVVKTEINWESRDCPGCPGLGQPRTFAIDPASAIAPTAADGRIHWSDANVAPHRAYRYQVAVNDQDERPLTLSNATIAKIFSGPVAPSNVTAVTQPQGILIRWKPVAKDAQGHNLEGDLLFRVERMTSGKPWDTASPAPVNGNTYLDDGVAAEQNYQYRIVPILTVENTAIFGEPSTVIAAKAPQAVLPPPPKSVWVTPSKGALEVRWSQSAGKTGGYHVYRREGKQIVRLTATPVQQPPFIDKNVRRNVTYSYAVSAISAQAGKEGLLSKWAEMKAVLVE